MGVNAIKEGIRNTAKGSIAKTLLTTNIKYTGGTLSTRSFALGADMATNGAIAGAVDSGVRYTAGDTDNKFLKGFVQEIGTGTLGGLVLAPVIGGGMRALGNSTSKITDTLKTKVATNYTQAKNALKNAPTINHPDKEVIKGFSQILQQAQKIVDDLQVKNSNIANDIEKTYLI